MTSLLNRNVEGPQTHAFVVGVGDYPAAKQGKGVLATLQKVPDLPSSADSAKLVCDWLLENQDNLAAPLASLEVLISDPGQVNDRYAWARGPVDRATAQNVSTVGYQWYQRLLDPESTAFFYCCGHGASRLERPTLFLGDLNQDARNAWPHINLDTLAHALRKMPSLTAGFLFSDACGEFIPEFELRDVPDCRFWDDPGLFAQSWNRVSLLCAAAAKQFAYEGSAQRGGRVMLGQFTQTVVHGLRGSSSRWCKGRWGVHPRALLDDLKSLRSVFFNHWEEPFEPYPAVSPTDRLPIVFPTNPEVPVVITTEPEDEISNYSLIISARDDPLQPWLRNRESGPAIAWATTVSAGHDALFAVAQNGAGHFSRVFVPNQPAFEQWVTVA
jgi:hypothetical protein